MQRVRTMFEHFDHTADLGLRVKAATLEQLLVESGRGLLAMLVANPEAVRGVQSRTVELSASEPAYLLFDWLSELLYAFESEKLLLAEFAIELGPAGGVREHPDSPDSSLVEDYREADASRSPICLRATCRGEPMDPARHTMDHEVKAITYHGLTVQQNHDGTWQAEVIVDI
ncbi:MAG: archease [Planctomycetaceae bacterium]|nr:archease [Planctomycetaceae bacterium]